MIKKFSRNNNKIDISSGKKIVGFLFTIFGILTFLSVWFLLGQIFDIIKIKDVGLNVFNLLKDNFRLKIWESNFYFKIIKTVFNVFASFTICLLLGGFVALISKFYYFKSFFASLKIINLIPILFIAYLLCVPFKNISFNNNFYKFDDFIFPVIVTSLVNCSFFANSIKKNIDNEENDFFNFIIKGINLTFVVVVTSEIILSNLKKVSEENIGGLITSEFNKNNTKVISLIAIFLLLILITDSIVLIIKKIANLFKK